MENKKILFFLDSLNSGGKERRAVELIHYLHKNSDFDIEIVLISSSVHYTSILELGISVVFLERSSLRKDPKIFFAFLQHVRSSKPDIIHSWGRMATFYSIPAKILLKKPLIGSLIAGGKDYLGKWTLTNFFFRMGCLFSDKILSNSYSGIEAFNLRNNRTRVIYNGVNLKRFEISDDVQTTRNKLGITSKFVLIMVASFSKYKDYNLFLNVATKIFNRRNDVTFLAVGEGENFSYILKRIKDEKISNVKLLGKRNDVESIVKASDIGLLFTSSEGISNAIIEYMALGKPVITNDVFGGSKELIIDGSTGFILDLEDKIAEKIEVLLEKEELRLQLGMNGQKIIKEKFSIERMGKEFKTLYKEILFKEI